jgi:hypothetical protein
MRTTPSFSQKASPSCCRRICGSGLLVRTVTSDMMRSATSEISSAAASCAASIAPDW